MILSAKIKSSKDLLAISNLQTIFTLPIEQEGQQESEFLRPLGYST